VVSETGSWRRFGLLVSSVAAIAVGGAGAAHAGAEPHLKSGVVGIARLQTARLSAVNYEPTAVESSGPGVDSCVAILAFQEVENTPNPTRTAKSASRQVTLGPGDIATLDFRSADLFAAGSTRLRSSFLASVRLVPEACLSPTGEVPPGPCLYPPGPCRNVVVSLEVFDTITGRTNTLLGHSSFVDDADVVSSTAGTPPR
jgi:hypothetical protein